MVESCIDARYGILRYRFSVEVTVLSSGVGGKLNSACGHGKVNRRKAVAVLFLFLTTVKGFRFKRGWG